MKNKLFMLALLITGLLNVPFFAQSEDKPDSLGLPGDNLDLYAVLDLFQKSKTIEDFEKSLNLEKTGINNLDLNMDSKVDFIKVVTKKDGNDFTFILQDAVNEKEMQDVAVIMVSKDKNGKVTIQIVGDPALYGKNYIVEPKAASSTSATANPGYTGSETVKTPPPVNTTTVVVESSPVIVYMYSPAYVPYVPPYHYGYYPPYFAAFTVITFGVYHANHYNNYYHNGSYRNTTVVINNNTYNNYNVSRNTSTTVNRNNVNGNYQQNKPSERSANPGGAKPTGAAADGEKRPAGGTEKKSTASPKTTKSSGGEGRGTRGGGNRGGKRIK